ncbi:MAG: hypothetical protein COW32_02105 [Candidatus Aquicultor secundus]|uniref:Uncharacterized protein n=1 Tax=Candidatus Aquicultor secundus TaxID=1973895 RepID=A0A2M7T9C9_9ACTN|nr:MAG: hypothetical protein COW32_02105 [Candidatus Aquicultor secundus]PIX52599.1 MAG: hypothetical protein COZ51_03390 [Candidatus Aquicultor secundus]PIY41788.1 MAG: hypothetical protein COZ03_01190 [Candidatus Aquicultor secundus]PIZ41019.1 MAG: hypothetical protein COY37_02950 [Candidatus Aquicultor secundus]PJB77794.1 MAG: hypothetical protein CO091_06195 [Candidatus Aquicultor secundus]
MKSCGPTGPQRAERFAGTLEGGAESTPIEVAVGWACCPYREVWAFQLDIVISGLESSEECSGSGFPCGQPTGTPVQDDCKAQVLQLKVQGSKPKAERFSFRCWAGHPPAEP